jgi:acyl-coenzyme A thioesterase PaaI-like protein
MKYFYQKLDQILANPSPFKLSILDKALKIIIPFNAPHGFKLKTLSADEVVISLSNKKLNHNHLGGIHACAIATLGEYCAGIALLKCLGINKYRLILAELNVKYTYQGRADLEGVCSIHQIDLDKIKIALNNSDKYLQELKTNIKDIHGKEVALVTSLWQLKDWEKVKTK